MNNRFLRLKKALQAVLLILLLCATGMMGMYAQRPNQNSTTRDVPEGGINGLFSVAPGYQVYFSQGNLQYQPSSNTWRFATNQYDLIHTVDEMVHYDEELEAYYCDVANEYTSTYAGWIDMFGWGTSGYNHGAVCYQPWDISLNEDDYNVYGSETYNLYDQTGQADWGYNAISNGGYQQCQWRTLNGGEWVFLLDCRNTNSGVRFAKAKVGGADGVIVLPDNWQVSTFALNNVNQKDASFNSNVISTSDWMVLEGAGAVFLPASGVRFGAKLFNRIVNGPMEESTMGEYWASSISPRFDDEHYPSNLTFFEDELYPRNCFDRFFGCGVRLVHEGQGAALQGYSPWEFGPTGGSTGVENGITTESYTFLGLAYYGSCPILEKGACWSTSPNPTLDDNHIAGEEGTDYVTGTIHGLTPNTTYYLRMYVSDSLYTYFSENEVFTTLPVSGDTHEYVDLGLPSGTLWATCNVGANASEEYGDYFAWGETQPKDYYDWDTYSYCMGSYNTMTKYCNNVSFGYNGFTDTLTILLPEDDAATANWGSEWRMPTKEEWQELHDNTTQIWTTQNGVNGKLFTASNGNSFFLPAAGYYYQGGLNGAGGSSYYWSSSLYMDNPGRAWSFYFYSADCYMNHGGRGLGQPIRPVRSNAEPTSEVPEGAINGLFSVGEGQQVYFSQGNLQYQASTNTWKFADNQWDYVGEGNNNISPTYDGWIDLFGWGTSGYDHGAICYQPWSTSGNGNYYYAYGQWDYNLNDQSGQADWGYNAISNGGNQENQWFTLSSEEWLYVFETRNTSSGIRYAAANVNGVNGLLLLPDDWEVSYYTLNNTNPAYNSWSFEDNIITVEDWISIFEPNGVVFLPTAGGRVGTFVGDVGTWGLYWSSTISSATRAMGVHFHESDLYYHQSGDRYSARSVRLVHSIQNYSYNINVTPNPMEGGTVTGAGTYYAGETCTLTATANEGYSFVNWTENGTIVSENSVYAFTVTGNRNLVANFNDVSSGYVITATANPTEGGRIVFGMGEQTLLLEPFEEYTVGNKIAAGAIAAGHDWWTTWSNNPGSNEDGTIANYDGTQCGHFIYGNDQVLLLGDEETGVYDLEFDILVPEGKNGYFCLLHYFDIQNINSNTWAMQCYLHQINDGQNSTQAPGHGTIHAGSNGTADLPCVYDAWMHFRLHVDTDNDVASYYYTAPGEEEILVCEWQWSLDSFGENVTTRTLAAMDFFPSENTATSEFYLDNFSFKRVGGVSAPVLSITPMSVQTTLVEDDMTTVPVTINNYGNSVGEWMGWIDFGQGGAGSQTVDLYYHDGEFVYGIGSPDTYNTREMGMRLPATAYAGASMGMKIVSAQYYVSEWYQSADYNYIFRIYGQGQNNQPGELLAEKTVYSTASGTWITATFDNPVYMTGQTIWVTVQLEQAVNEYPMTMDGGEYGEEQDANWLSTNGSSFSHHYSSGNFGGAWLISVNCQGTPIPGFWASINKNDGSIMGGQAETITLNIFSIGFNWGTSYNANLIINTNDENLSHVEIPVTLNVSYNKSANETGSSELLHTMDGRGSVRISGTYEAGSTCTLTAIANPGYTFTNWTKNGIVVSTTSTYSFTVTENAAYVANFTQNQGEITQVSDLAAGWNWWSTYIEQEGIEGLTMLEQSLGSNGHQIKSQTDFVTNYGFMWMGMLSSINNEETYMIDNTADCQIELTGAPVSPSDHPITINNGWNWIGYPCTNTMSVAEAFSGYTPTNGDQVKSQSDYAMYFGGMWIGQLLDITPGTGLMYLSNNATTTTLVYPDGNRNTKAIPSAKATHWTNDIHAYPNNMTVMAVINLDDEELSSDNYELATFDINGECRGSVKLTYVEPINRYVAFLTVSGKEATELNFGLYDSETGREYFNTEKALVYVTNATIGNPDEPYVVRFRSTTGMDELTNSLQVYPNPVNRGERFSINVADEERSPVRVEIVNALGMVVETVCTPSSVQTLTAPNAAGVYTLRITMEGKGTLVRKLVVK